jgi:hypothetical protein
VKQSRKGLIHLYLGSEYGRFLDDFILSTYIPSLEGKVQHHVSKYINGPDGFVVGNGNLLQVRCFRIP